MHNQLKIRKTQNLKQKLPVFAGVFICFLLLKQFINIIVKKITGIYRCFL